MVSEHNDECKVKPRLNAVNLPRQMRSLQLQFVWSLSSLQYQHDNLERWHLGLMTVMRSDGSPSHNDTATPPTQRKTSTVEELHSFPRLLVEWGKARQISCSANKRHHAHTNPHPPQPFTAVRLKCHTFKMPCSGYEVLASFVVWIFRY